MTPPTSTSSRKTKAPAPPEASGLTFTGPRPVFERIFNTLAPLLPARVEGSVYRQINITTDETQISAFATEGQVWASVHLPLAPYASASGSALVPARLEAMIRKVAPTEEDVFTLNTSDPNASVLSHSSGARFVFPLFEASPLPVPESGEVLARFTSASLLAAAFARVEYAVGREENQIQARMVALQGDQVTATNPGGGRVAQVTLPVLEGHHLPRPVYVQEFVLAALGRFLRDFGDCEVILTEAALDLPGGNVALQMFLLSTSEGDLRASFAIPLPSVDFIDLQTTWDHANKALEDSDMVLVGRHHMIDVLGCALLSTEDNKPLAWLDMDSLGVTLRSGSGASEFTAPLPGSIFHAEKPRSIGFSIYDMRDLLVNAPDPEENNVHLHFARPRAADRLGRPFIQLQSENGRAMITQVDS